MPDPASCSNTPWRAFLCRTSAAGIYAALFVGVWAWAYGHPAFLNPDFTTVEDMFRDIAAGGSLMQWRLPRSSYYQDILLYLAVRALGGDVHQGLALFAAAQACLVVSGAWYALTRVFRGRFWPLPLSALLYMLIVHTVEGAWLLGNMAHVITLAVCLWSAGLLVRRMRGEGPLWPLLALVALTTWCDFVFVLWFVLPAFMLLAVQALPPDRRQRRQCVLNGVTIACAVAAGRGLDLLTRAYPAERMGSFKPHVLPEYAGKLVANSLAVAAAEPLLAACWVLGLGALLRRAWSGEPSACRLARFALCGMALNVLVIAMHAMGAFYYYLLYAYLPLLLGVPLALEAFDARRAGAWAGGWRAAALAAGCLGLLGWSAADVWNRREPLYPPGARCLDRLAALRPDVSMLTPYPFSHDRFFSRQANVRVGAILGQTLYPYEVNSNPASRPTSYNAVMLALAPGSAWETVNLELLRRLNGEPEMAFACPETADGTQVWLYPDGVRAATSADVVFDAERLAPELAAGDVELWNGRHRFADGLTLVRVSTALRWDERWCVLEFDAEPRELHGKRFMLSFAGDKSPSHRRWAAARLSRAENGPLAFIYRRLLHTQRFEASGDSLWPLPGGRTAVYGSISSRHSTFWPVFDVLYGEERVRLASPVVGAAEKASAQ